MSQIPDQTSSSLTPPSDPGELPLGPKSWPKVVGILSIVWGSLALICNGCGLVTQVFQSAMMGMVPQQPGGQSLPPIPDVMKAKPIELVSYVLGFGLGVWLIVAGSMLIGRRPVARMLHLIYAILGIVLTLAGSAIAVQKQLAIVEWAKQNPDNQWTKFQGQGGGDLGLIIVALFTVIGLSYPLFLLIWFAAIKRDATDLDGGHMEPTF